MADPVNGAEAEEEVGDYEEEEAAEPDQAKTGDETAKRGYVGLHTAGFKEFLLKPEILRAITKNAFEHPSEGRHRGHPRLPASSGKRCCIPPCLYQRSFLVLQFSIKLLCLFCPSCSRSKSSLMTPLSLQRLEL